MPALYMPVCSHVQAIVQYMQDSNPGRPIPADKVLGFATPSDANSWLTQNPERVLGGVHFSEGGEKGTLIVARNWAGPG
jgi:hypothetical protein